MSRGNGAAFPRPFFLASFVAVKEEGLTLADVARTLNVSKQSILRGIVRERAPKE